MKVSLLLAAASVLALASAAHASDLMVAGPGPIQYAPESSGWGGGYVGVFGGYGVGTATSGTPDNIFPGDELDLEGGFIGATAGWNFALSEGGGGLVVGVAGDIAASQIQGYEQDLFGTEAELEWTGSLRANLGFDAGALMPYLTAGLAGAAARVNYAGDAQTVGLWGWTAGAGVQFAASDNMVVDFQYRYTDYGTGTYENLDPEITDVEDVSFVTHQVSAGLNWKF